MNNQLVFQGVILVAFVAIMYFLLIKPQKKKEKEIDDMRNSIQVGDEIVTIGGICGKVVKTKDDTLILQVGADKTKFELKRWAVSSIEKKSGRIDREKLKEEEEKKPNKPKRIGRKDTESLEGQLAEAKEELKAEANTAAVEAAIAVEHAEAEVEEVL